jgi:mannose/fructose/N-acetylgalactosamine-specific phosphotransferase system component IIC
MEPTITDEVAKVFLEGMPIANFILFYGIAVFGMFGAFAFQVDAAIKNNPKTPSKFEWKRLLSASSILRFIASLGFLAIAIPHYEGIIAQVFNAEVPGPINVPGALLLGIGIDQLAGRFIGKGANLFSKK